MLQVIGSSLTVRPGLGHSESQRAPVDVNLFAPCHRGFYPAASISPSASPRISSPWAMASLHSLGIPSMP